ncbi:MAG: class I SAM-dependent methyltransferase [Betaproteobacteria bacterium]
MADLHGDDRAIIESAGEEAAWSAWRRWLASPPGRYVLAWEQSAIDDAVVDVFGYNAVQCGTAELNFLRSNRMPNRACVLPGDTAREGQRDPGISQVVIDQFEELPFASQSLDLVVLPHVLEFAADPYQVLREVDRVLRPEGRMVVSGFNPVSLWGLRETFAQAVGRAFLPPQARRISLLRLRDWLRLLGYSPSDAGHGCFRPGCATERWLDRFNFLESAGDRWWPILGAVYLQSAVKRLPGMTLQGPVWRKRFSSQAAPVATHRGTCNRETGAAGLQDRRRLPPA